MARGRMTRDSYNDQRPAREPRHRACSGRQDLSLTHGKINSNGAVVVVRDTVGIYEILLRSASVRFFRACRASLKSDSAMQFQTRSESEATAIVTNLLHDL